MCRFGPETFNALSLSPSLSLSLCVCVLAVHNKAQVQRNSGRFFRGLNQEWRLFLLTDVSPAPKPPGKNKK